MLSEVDLRVDLLYLPQIVFIIEISSRGGQAANHELVRRAAAVRIQHRVLGVNHGQGAVVSNVLNVKQQGFHYDRSGPTFVLLLLLQSPDTVHTEQKQAQSQGQGEIFPHLQTVSTTEVL